MPPLSDPEGPRWHARRLLEEANARKMALEGQGLAFFCSPRALAKYLGFWILEGTGTGEETTTGERVVYDGWTGNPDQREVGIRVFRGVCLAYALREGLDPDPHDVWKLTLAVAVPYGALLAGVEEVIERQRHCPTETIRKIAEDRNLDRS
jgi:hypothetical protein